jgi:hypothetical protein
MWELGMEDLGMEDFGMEDLEWGLINDEKPDKWITNSYF